MSTLLSSIAGGGGLPRLAPDLTFPSDKNGQQNTKVINGIDGSAELATALSLTGKFIISSITLSNFTAESSTVKLTVDGVVIWNDTYTTATGPSNFLSGPLGATSTYQDSEIQCNTSFLLEIATTTDTSVDLIYVARPIL